MTVPVVSLLIFSVITIVVAQKPCITPNGENAQCISIYKCKVFVNALSNRTSEVVRFMRESHCGYVEDPLVCCGSVAKYMPLSTQPPPIPTTRGTPLQHRNINLLEPRKACGIQSFEDRVYGGNMTGLDEFPWMALLEYRSNGKSVGHSCGGVLINKRYILTAAHCIVGQIKIELGDVFRVRLGEYDQNTNIDCVIYPEGDRVCGEPHVDIDVEEAIAHPQYDEKIKSRYHDIGILRLRQAVTYTEYIKPICLPLHEESTPAGRNLSVAGWGLTEKGIYSPIKLKADVPVVSERQCSQIYTPQNVLIAKSQLCAGGQKGIDSCSGDSGGPLVTTFPNSTEFYVEGVVSFGPTFCGTQGVPGIYTRVSEYMGWILDNMRPF